MEPTPGPKILRLAYGPGDISTIDPALAWDTISIQIIEETTVGLLRQNEVTTELENAMAKDWSISDDGLTYTFSLRDDVPWVRFNGEAVEQIYDCNGNPRMVTAKRAALYAQAEEILVVEEAVIIPLHWYAQEVLIQPEIGFVPSIIGIDHYEKWDIEP